MIMNFQQQKRKKRRKKKKNFSVPRTVLTCSRSGSAIGLHASKDAFMLNLRRQNQRFETLIQNAVHGGAVYAHFFRARKRADFVNMHCACACYAVTQEGRSNWGARFLGSFEFRLFSELFMHGPGRGARIFK